MDKPCRTAACAGAAVAALSVAGCFSEHSVRAPQAFVAALADKATCETRYVRSIWAGRDSSGPECAGYVAYAGHAPNYDPGRILRVCERAEIRTILTGDASTIFTSQACSLHRDEYQQATIGGTCRKVSAGSRAREEELTPAQSTACKEYLGPARLSSAQTVARHQAMLGSETVLRSQTALGNQAVPGNQVVLPQRQSAFANIPESAPSSVVEGVVDRATCETRYIESIWKGLDVNSGSECARYIRNDGYAPDYNHDRVQSVCEGALARSQKTGTALKPFTTEACTSALRARAPEEPVQAQPVAVADASAPATPERRGLSEAEIAHTVDANWRSIGRDCFSLAPTSGSLSEPVNTAVTVTLTVDTSGEVRNASARARGHAELESCIETSVRTWHFPTAELDTVIGIPLVFAGK